MALNPSFFLRDSLRTTKPSPRWANTPGFFPVVACAWDESISGRSSNDILSCFHHFIERFSDSEEMVMWLDNCAAQNKKWNMFHLYPDFSEVLRSSKKNTEVLDMKPAIFFQSFFTVSQYTLNKLNPRPFIDCIRQVIIQKGSFNLHYSETVSKDSELVECMLFTKKQQKVVLNEAFDLHSTIKFNKSPKGIDSERKTALLRTILPVIPEEKKAILGIVAIENNEFCISLMETSI